MKGKLRETGIDVVDGVPWGTHFCQFYRTKEDLLDILVPYFKEGLENNEFCIWVTSEPLKEEEAKEAMRGAVPHFDKYLKKGQIEVVPHSESYLKDGVFDQEEVLNAWIDKLEGGLTRGYDGMRVTGNISWLEKRDWRDFTRYEEKINGTIDKYKMIAMCSYPLERCGPTELIEVMENHRFALVKREGQWDTVHNAEGVRREEALRESEEKLRTGLEAAIQTVALMVEMKSAYMAGHQRRVTDLACAIARGLHLSGDEVDGIRMAGSIHDIGNMGVPAEILNKSVRLAHMEFELIKTHPVIGYNILKEIQFPWPVAKIVLQHHERIDGSGYPDALFGDDILIEARILAVADVVEALASHRPFRPALGIDKALEEIREKRGTLYDQEVVDACLKLFTEKGFKFKESKEME